MSSTTAWVHSPVYGSAVLLGPTQYAVYRFVLGVTDHGRRPTFPLWGIAEATGKPVSSVHEALGRLRALGLIGVAARMGRSGGHRLWRAAIGSPGTRSFDAARRSRAIARVIKRWGSILVASAQDHSSRPVRVGLWSDPDGTSDAHPSVTPIGGPSGEPVVNDPGSPGSFRERMRVNGFTPWWRVASDDTTETPEGDACARAFVEVAGS